VTSGYAGGETENPTYKDVCTGTTGHAEVIQVEYDPSEIGYRDLLAIFFATHDPTTLNRQGADVGTQYRSVIFTHNEEQQEIAENLKKELDQSGEYADPIVTQIEPCPTFYAAEGYHQDYYQLNEGQPYCRAVISGGPTSRNDRPAASSHSSARRRPSATSSTSTNGSG